MHISLDGFVAGPKGEMDWIKHDQEIFDFVGKRISTCETSLYGRVTFEMMENYWPTAAKKSSASKHDIEHSKWYKQVQKVVLSKSLDPNTYRETGLTKTKFISGNLLDSINEIKQSAPTSADSGSEDILLFGSPTATHSLVQEHLIDGFWLFINPIILGRSIPLFVNVQDKINLKLLTTYQFKSGVVELNYLVKSQ